MSSFKTVMSNDLLMMIRSGNTLNIIDVRETYEFERGHIPGAINIPLSAFDLNKLDKSKEYYVVCETGARSIEVAKALAQYGYKIINVMGGTSAYRGMLVR
ncbi:MAG: rhodanese-like domain-containing protein [Bacilli bacterium]|nr:rhodanese-like domain-containing protein [Bacilli bacterium]